MYKLWSQGSRVQIYPVFQNQMTTKTLQNYFSENGQVLLQFSFERGLFAELLGFEPIRMTNNYSKVNYKRKYYNLYRLVVTKLCDKKGQEKRLFCYEKFE